MSTAGADRITWVGHATVTLEIDGARLLTDPVLGPRLAVLTRHAAPPSPDVLRALDAVLISHLHYDHLHLPSLRRLGRAARLVVPRGAGHLLGRAGFSDVTEVAAGDRLHIRGVPVEAVPARHDARRRPGGPTAPPLGFVAGSRAPVYFAGDTAVFPEMSALAGRLDVALLPVWGWGPTLGPGHMDPREAAAALALLKPAVAVPIHWGTLYPIGVARVRGKALVRPPHSFAALAAQVAPGVRVEILAPGETLTLRGAGRSRTTARPDQVRTPPWPTGQRHWRARRSRGDSQAP
jgi:L-ascorbate metabolism protein UlaG (beta-lactamase superfamily)